MTRTVVLLALVCWLAPLPSDACSYLVLPHSIDEAEQKVDSQPPDRAAGEVGQITRGSGPRPLPDGMLTRSCDDIGWIEVVLTQFRDDRTPTDKLGYRVTVVDGTVPGGFRVPAGVLRLLTGPERQPRFLLRWVDGAHDNQEPFDFTFTVTAVDLAGNEGPPSAPIRASHPGSSTSNR